MSPARLAAGVALAAALGVACSGGGDATCSGASAVTLSQVQAQVFTPSCAIPACHSGESPAESLTLVDGSAYQASVNVRSILDPSKLIVDPKNPSQSELYILVNTAVMPNIGQALPESEQTLIHDWICGGAVNDCPRGPCFPNGDAGAS